MSGAPVQLDFNSTQATSILLPNSAVLSSTGWPNLHFELHRQPAFETPEHQSPWHVIAQGIASASEADLPLGERWLDGKLSHERRYGGDIAIIPADVSQRCSWKTEAEFAILAVDPALLQQVGQDLVNPDRIELIPRFMSHRDALIQGIFATIKAELLSSQIGGDLLIDSLKTTLAIHLLRNYCTLQPKLSRYSRGLSASTLRQIKEYIRSHLHQEIKLAELAAVAQISPYHFLRLFKQKMGVTPHQYILQQRVEQAKFLLCHTELSLAEIALRVGFCDQSHLTRSFKRLVGITPKQLLQSNRNNVLKSRNFLLEP
jgi:AraC family transcriptional regulator